MSGAVPSMRLVRDEDVSDPSASAPPVVPPGTVVVPESPAVMQAQIQTLQSELDALNQELNVLRRRDETLNFYMHRLDEEFRLAARLQQDFLPKFLPQIGHVRFHTLFRPAGYVSGDFYDIARLDEDHVGFFIVDAVGHGMPAALLTMFVKRALVTKEVLGQQYRLVPPAESLTRLNDSLVEQNLSQATYTTALYGVVNVRTLQMTFSRGGHPCPLLMRPDGEMIMPECEGSILGIFAGETYGTGNLQLAPGDRLFIYSDGIEVAFEDESDELGRWREELYKRRHMSAEEMLIDLCNHLDRESGSLTPKDDLTMIILEVTEKPQEGSTT